MKSRIGLNWGLLSENRQAIMGGAILCIMLYHSFQGASDGTISRLFITGKMGVEFFLMISGIGLYFSLSKDSDLGRFYEKRLVRILPEYLIISIPIYLSLLYYKGGTFLDFVLNISMLNFFWGEGAYFWFIHMILICYMIAPFYFRILERKPVRWLSPIVFIVVSYMVSYFYPAYQMILPRYASFLLGMSLGKIVMIKKEIQGGGVLVMAWPVVLGLLYISTYKGQCGDIWLEPAYYFLLSIPLIIYLALLLGQSSVVYKLFCFLGGITLELYLLHEMFFLKGTSLLFDSHIVSCVVSIMATIPFAFLLSKLNKRVIKMIQH